METGSGTAVPMDAAGEEGTGKRSRDDTGAEDPYEPVLKEKLKCLEASVKRLKEHQQILRADDAHVVEMMPGSEKISRERVHCHVEPTSSTTSSGGICETWSGRRVASPHAGAAAAAGGTPGAATRISRALPRGGGSSGEPSDAKGEGDVEPTVVPVWLDEAAEKQRRRTCK